MSTADQPSRAVVPCGPCTACCRFGVTPVSAEEQAREHYAAEVVDVPGMGRIWALKRRSDGTGCIYLGPSGCTIWNRAPQTCKRFDCRTAYAALDRPARRRQERQVPQWREVFAAARQRGAGDPPQ